MTDQRVNTLNRNIFGELGRVRDATDVFGGMYVGWRVAHPRQSDRLITLGLVEEKKIPGHYLRFVVTDKGRGILRREAP